MLVDGGGGGGGEAAALFPYAEDDALSASPATISGLADTIEGSAGNLESLGPSVDTAHQPALTGTADVLHTLSASAPTPTKNNISQVLLATLCASGATRVFGTDGVQAYNTHVDSIRSEYYRRKAEIMSSDCGVAAASYPEGATSSERSTIDSNRSDAIDGKRTAAVAALVTELQTRQDGYKDDPLDAQATTAANRLNQGPTDQVLIDLFAAGGLPSTTVEAFPTIQFRYEDLPSDLAAMDNGELAEYLTSHPDLLTNDNIMAAVRERIEQLTAEDGASDGSSVRGAIEQWVTARPDDGEAALANLALLGLYGSYAQRKGLTMPDGGADYLNGFFGELKAHDGYDDITMDVIDWIESDEHEYRVQVPTNDGGGQTTSEEHTTDGFDDSTQDFLLQGFANSLLVLSDNDLDEDLGFDAVPESVWNAIDDIPHTETEFHASTGGAWTGIELKGGDGFREFAELMSHATAEPGLVMAGEMTESAGELAGLINMGYNNAEEVGTTVYFGFDDGLEDFGPLMQDVVEVASRNEEANQMLLWQADHELYPEVTQQLTNLYTFPWPDDGEAVSGYTDWIADASASDDPERVALANEASANFINFVTDTGGDGEPNTFKTLMQGGTPDEWFYEGDPLSFGDVNPHLAQSFGLVAGSNLDALGADLPSHDTTYEDDGTVGVSLGDRSRLFTLVATNDDGATALSQTIGAYEQSRLDAALAGGQGAPSMEEVARETSRLDGYMGSGLLNESLISQDGAYQNAQDAYAQHMQNANIGKTIITTGLGEIPGVGGLVSSGTGLFFDEVITGGIEPPKIPDGYTVPEEIGSDDAVQRTAAYDFVAAMHRADRPLPGFLLDDGELRSLGDLSPTEIGHLRDYVDDNPAYEEYHEGFLGNEPFRDGALNDQGTYHQHEVEKYLEGR